MASGLLRTAESSRIKAAKLSKTNENRDYRIERNGIDQYLLIYINSGSLCIRTDGMTAEAHEDEIALFDCRNPHCCWCPDKVDFY